MPPIPPPNAPPIQNSNDPQRGRWGGLHERDGRDGRRLDARLDPLVMARGAGTLVFDLSVSSTDGSELHGPVKFHLHHRFPKPIQSIKSIRHRAAIWKQIRTDKGTFTVGAQAKTQSGEWVGLEYDLATLPNLPLKFIPNRQKAFARWLKVRTSAMIPGIAFKDILNQVVDAYTLPGLTREVQFQLNVPLATVVNVQAPFEDVVFELVRWADQQGRVGDLVRELAAARPKHSGMQAIARQYAALLTPSANPKEYVHYFGDTPAVDIQQGGKSEAKVPVKDAGFELQLNKALGYFDAAYFADMLGRMTRRVCRVELSGASGKMGTGFLVGPRALLTNYHVMEDVIKAPAVAGRVKFRFDYFKATPGGQPSVGVEVGLDTAADLAKPWLLGFGIYSDGEKQNTPDDPPPKAGELDFALVRLDRAIGDEAGRGWVEVPVAQPMLAETPLLMILQHPATEPVKLAFDSTPKVEEKFGGLRVRYQVNTDPGSSGSPVFDKEWRLAALHQYGVPGANQGVPIGVIHGSLSAAAKAELGGPAEASPRLEVSAAATAALSDRFAAGAGGVSREDVEGIIKAAAKSALADPLSLVPGMTDREREVIDRKIKEADDEWDTKFTGTNNPVEWERATNRKKMLICHALKQAKQLNGGELPDDWVKRWVKLNCGN